MGIEFHRLTEHVPTTHIGQAPKVGRRALPLPAHVLEIVADVPAVAEAMATLGAAIDELRKHADAMDHLSDEFEDYRAAYRATAAAGKVPTLKPDAYWQARADKIRDAHDAAVPPAVDAQTALVLLAEPHVSARQQADRDRIMKMAGELDILIGRATNYSTGSVVVDGFQPLGSVENLLRALRVIGRSA